MNGLSADGLTLAQEVMVRAGNRALRCDLLVCPPATILAAVAEVLKRAPVAVGGQDCHPKASGAHTGDVSAPMLRDAGASYVIVGHSERRADHGETDAVVCAKAIAARGAGLVPIVCIGETASERDSGKTLEVLACQIAGSVPPEIGVPELVVAYEPVWAIGTGRTPTEAEIADAHRHVRAEIAKRLGGERAGSVRILYGGSLNPKNARTILAIPGVNGGLIGGASLKAEDFLAVAESCP